MYGYVKTYTPELKVRELEEYKGMYCSLCRTLGKRYGILSRLLLSYDLTFLALFLSGLSGKVCFSKGRCPFNPAKKCGYCSNTELEYCADLTVIFAYHKLLDNISDEGFFKRLVCRILRPYFAHLYGKAEKLRPEACLTVSSMMEEQKNCECDNAGIDRAADPTAKALGKLCGYGAENEADKAHRYRFGYCTGRWVYMCDAFDDLKDDIKKGSFNPFVSEFGEDAPEKTAEIENQLNMTVGALAECLDELEFSAFGGIIENIVRDGLFERQKAIILKYSDERE